MCGVVQERLEAMLEMKRARNRLKEDEIRDFIEKKDRAEDYRWDGGEAAHRTVRRRPPYPPDRLGACGWGAV